MLFLMGVLPFNIFCKKRSFSLLHTHFDVYHYLVILCYFDHMNDRMMFFLLLNQYSCHCDAS